MAKLQHCLGQSSRRDQKPSTYTGVFIFHSRFRSFCYKSQEMTERTRKIVVMIITILLAAWMILAGVGKLMQPEEVLQMWDKWGYPAAFMMFIGVAEIAGSIGLFIPKLRKLAALGLIIIMIGAVVTHGINDEYSNLMGPIIAIFMLVLTIVLRRPIGQKE